MTLETTIEGAGRWMADPTSRHELRYWSGSRWTEHVSDAGVAGIDPLPTTSAGTWKDDPTGRHQWRLWTGSDWGEHVNDGGTVTIDADPAGLTSDPPVQPSEKERKRHERETQKVEARQRKAELLREKQAAAAKRAEAEMKQCGREVESGTFASKTIRIYELGFVRVTGLFERSDNVIPRRLISIEASADVGKKSGVGRTVGAAMTGGFSLLGSNKRGDVYLTIVTDGQTYALHETPPTERNMKTSKKLEAVGNSVMRQREQAGTPKNTSSGGQPASTRERLVELKSLLDDGLISQQEFDEKRRVLLNGI